MSKVDLRECDLSFLDRMKFKWRANKDERLTPGAKLVLDNLLMRVNCRYEECFPGRALICEDTCLSDNAVRAAVRSLRDEGWITWRELPNGGYCYRLLWDNKPHLTLDRVPRQTPAESAPPQKVHPSESAGETPQKVQPNTPTEITNIPSSTRTAADREIESKPRASAEANKPLQEGSPEWWKERVWNQTGERFKARFYPTTSKAAFKSRLGGVIRRQQHDLRAVDRALTQALEAEPGGDAWEYVTGMLRNRAEEARTKPIDYREPLKVRGVM